MSTSKKDISCPTCGKKETWQPDNAHRPFCGARCKLIDLGEWASEKHRIPTDEKLPSDDNSPHEEK